MGIFSNFRKNQELANKTVIIEKKHYPILIAAGLIACYFGAKYWFGKKLQINFTGIKFTGSFISPQILVGIDLINSTFVSSTLSNISGTISFNKEIIGSLTSLDIINIKPHTTVPITITVIPSYTNILDSITTLIKGNIKGSQLTFDGFLTIDGFQFPLTQTITL